MCKSKKLIVMFFLCMFTFFGTREAYASVNTNRIVGHDRYETSLKVSKAKFSSSKNVILTTGQDFPDSLCATPLAKQLNAPIILINKTLNKNIKDEIRRLGAKNVYLVGGEGVILPSVEKELKAMNIRTERLGGKDRFITSLNVARKIKTGSSAFVVFSNNFPDAVSVGPISARDNAPILLSNGQVISEDNIKYIKQKGFSNVYVVGGPNLISNSVLSKIPRSQRIYGNDRYETNYKLAEKFMNKPLNKLYIATGNNFADAVVATAAAVKDNTFVTLCSNRVSTSMSTFLRAKLTNAATINILGGEKVVPKDVIYNIFNPKKTICIDPGHGLGSDGGAVGINGLREDDVTLAVGLKLGKILESHGLNVVYTRTRDMRSTPMSVRDSLQKRCDIAKENNADYFISIHCNSFSAESAHGIEVWYSLKNNPRNESDKLAKSIQKALCSEMRLTDRGVKNNANLYVNKNAPCPSVLVELGFITNPKEAGMLRDSSYQQKFATAISHGVFNYLKIK